MNFLIDENLAHSTVAVPHTVQHPPWFCATRYAKLLACGTPVTSTDDLRCTVHSATLPTHARMRRAADRRQAADALYDQYIATLQREGLI